MGCRKRWGSDGWGRSCHSPLSLPAEDWAWPMLPCHLALAGTVGPRALGRLECSCCGSRNTHTHNPLGNVCCIYVHTHTDMHTHGEHSTNRNMPPARVHTQAPPRGHTTHKSYTRVHTARILGRPRTSAHAEPHTSGQGHLPNTHHHGITDSKFRGNAPWSSQAPCTMQPARGPCHPYTGTRAGTL